MGPRVLGRVGQGLLEEGLVVGTPGDAATRRCGPDVGSVTVMRNVGGRLTYSSILDGTTAGVAGVLEGSSSLGWTLGTGR